MVNMMSGISLQITCKRDGLLDVLRRNRARHSELVQEARDGYVKKAREALERRLEQVRAGKVVALSFTLQPPVDYTSAYDTAIKMLEMHQGSDVTLSPSEFRQLVEDNWDWRYSFITSNAGYSVGTRQLADHAGSDAAVDSPMEE